MHVKALTLLRLPLTWAKIGSIHHEVALLRRSYSTCNISSLDGIYPPIPTPFHNGGVIFYKKLKENLAVWNKIPFAGGFSCRSFTCIIYVSYGQIFLCTDF